MKKEYQKPEMELLKFILCDIASSNTPGTDLSTPEFEESEEIVTKPEGWN